MSEKLLPCPFCGNLPEIRIDEEKGEWGDVYQEWVIECLDLDCPADAVRVVHDSAQQAIEAWNRRADHD